jgi:hypothetical protein
MWQRKLFGVMLLAFALLARISAPAFVEHDLTSPVCLAAQTANAQLPADQAPATPAHVHGDDCVLCGALAMAAASANILAATLDLPPMATPLSRPAAPSFTPRRLNANAPSRAPPALS